MIPVPEAQEPSSFDAKVRKKGLRAISELSGDKPNRKSAFKAVATSRDKIPPASFPTYWRDCLSDLMVAYYYICAYTCFRIHPVTGGRTVDHFAPKSRSWDKVYEWSNYRLACSAINAAKNSFEDVIDPFTLKPGYFELELVGYQVIPGSGLDDSERLLVQATIDRLGLDQYNDDRARDAEDYLAAEISLARLRKESPFVASELHRQGRLRTNDVWL
jgi:hypothetical protein